MIGILLLSHGELCQGMCSAMEVLGCDLTAVQAIPLFPDSELEAYHQSICDAIENLNSGDGVLVIVDLVAGTPFNQICTLYQEKKIRVVTGMNLPMCVTALDMRGSSTLEELAQGCLQEGKEGIIDVDSLFE